MTTELAIALTAVARAIDKPNDPTGFTLAAETLLGIINASDYCLLGMPGLLSCRVMQGAGSTDNAVRGMVTTAAQVSFLLGMSRALYGTDPFAGVDEEAATDA